jgi:hypothetical protein
MAIKSNVTSFGADILHYAGLKGEADSGPLFFALAHKRELSELKHKLDQAEKSGEKLRPIVLDYFKATPEGEELDKEYASLLAVKQKTPDQVVKQQTILELFNQVNIQTLRNIETLSGVKMLEALGRSVNITRIQGSNKYACYVLNNAKNDDGTMIEFIHVPFTATQLRRLPQLAIGTVNSGMATADIRKATDSLKSGAANKDKGNVDAIARGDIGKVAKQLETSIAGTVIDGKLEGVSAATRNDVMLLWAHLDATLSDEEKNKARAAFAKDAAPIEPVKTDVPVKVIKQGKRTTKAA